MRGRYRSAAVSLNRTAWLWIYYVGVLGMIVAGAVLWVTGHGTGDPYLSLGIALAFVPAVVIWIRRLLSRH
jgi:hypothetical protein